MRLILTHEQADFDAVASLLGKALTAKNEIALLPHQINRNVRNFLTENGSELPFKTLEQISTEKIEAITLVDTQSLITIKGVNKNTAFTVIDHHPLKHAFPLEWKFIETKTGATTTNFVQEIHQKGITISIVQASLLLLGIHEDTGSLTYASTTPEDIHAAAFLLEKGADLDLISKFLNPPLSSSQSILMDILIKNMTTLQIKEQSILISWADGTDLKDEISSIAHKIYDLLAPTALFLFVITNDGIRLVARSISDQINVGRIATQYGGGGHARAASALIHPAQDQTKLEFVTLIIKQFTQDLPSLINPISRVSQIMSRQPMLVSPNTTAREVLQLMQQFGYEGYPVVQNQRVLGLLTRRAVDRAITHKLNLPAISLMDAGSISISPEDTLEKLQYLMSSSGWGQVPVIDPSTKQVIGIVTRTDLLKSLAGGNGYDEQMNLAKELEKSLSPTMLALTRLISECAAETNSPIYLVGGIVRDILLKQPSQDLDFVSEGDAIKLAQLLAKKYGGRITSHRQFGTAKWIIRSGNTMLISPLFFKTNNPADLPASIDLISARTEFYSFPTALPTVKQGSIKLDLQRRDFTINTMAIRLDGTHYGELVDFWGGMEDLKEKLIRVLHSLSFVDDPTRVLRAIRFEQRLGFQFEKRTEQLLKEAIPLLEQVSGDRIRHEFDLVLIGNHFIEILQRMQELSILDRIHPYLKWEGKNNQILEKALHDPIEKKWDLPETVGKIPIQQFIAYLVIFSSIPTPQVSSLAKRLRLSAIMKTDLLQKNSLMAELPNLVNTKPSKIVKHLEKISPIVLYAQYLMTQEKKVRDLLAQFQFEWRNVKSTVNGKTLKKLGISPGPAYQKILYRLRSAWLDGEIHSQKEETRLLNKLVSESQ
jgi:tRNA nucleotidyltransferase (CCA-adding enzyme)